jgi:hypothetical protein
MDKVQKQETVSAEGVYIYIYIVDQITVLGKVNLKSLLRSKLMIKFHYFRRVRKITKRRLLALSCLSVRPFVVSLSTWNN